MGAISSINILFRADLSQFSSEIQSASREMRKYGDQLQSIGKTLTVGLTLPILAAGTASLKTYGDIQALQKGLVSVMGSTEAAAVEFEKLKEVAKLPGLGLEEAVRGSVNLQAAGFSADEARQALLSFGNALATVGKGKRELDLVTLAITQLNNKSGGFGQDLRQLTEQLPQLRGALQNAFGTVDTEKISKSGVTGKEVVKALVAEFEKLPKVTGGINNAFENFSDSSKLALASFGESINKAFNVEGLLQSFSDTLTELSEEFSKLSPASQKLILVLGGIAAAIGPVLVAIGAITSFAPSVVTGLVAIRGAFASLTATIAANPFGVLAVALSLMVSSYFLFNQETEKAIARVDVLNKLNQEAASIISPQIAQLKQYLSVATDETKKKVEREKAIRSLNKIAPEYLGNLKLETINTDEAKNSIERYNTALLEAGKAKAAQSALQSNYSKQLEAELKYENATAGVAEKILSAQKKLNSERGKDGYFQALREVNKLTQEQEALLNATLDPLKKEEAIILSVFNKYKDKLGLIKNLNSATMDLSKSNEKIFAPGTEAYFENQIKKLRNLQQVIPNTNAAWKSYEDRINEVKKSLDALTNTKVNLPKPSNDFAIEAPQASVFEDNLDGLKDQIKYYESLKGKFSYTREQALLFEETINGIQLKINKIEGVEEAKAALTDAQNELIANSQAVGNSVSDAFSILSANMIDSLNLAKNGLDGFLAGMYQTVTKLIAMSLANAISQSIAGAVAAGTATGPAAIFTTPAFISTAVGGVLAAFAAIPKFETGGIVGGSSYYGDKILARLNSREMILNTDQQRNLYSMINPAVTASDVAVQLMGGFEIEGTKLKLVLERADKKKNRIG